MIGQVARLIPILLGLKEILPGLAQLTKLVPSLANSTREVQEFLRRSREDREAMGQLAQSIAQLEPVVREAAAAGAALGEQLEQLRAEMRSGMATLRRLVWLTAVLAGLALAAALFALLR